MLLGAPAVPGCGANPKSTNVTPAVSPLMLSAYPAEDGATTAILLALYVQVDPEQSNPPNTVNPSRDGDVLTTRFSE